MATNNKKNRPSNYFIATVRGYRAADDDGGVKFSASGHPIAKCRASLSMGKDDEGNYKPSMWLELVGFTPEGDTPNEVTEAVGEIKNGDYVTVKGRLTMEEWTGDDGVTRQSFTVWVKEIEDFDFGNGADAAEEEEVDEEEDDDLI